MSVNTARAQPLSPLADPTASPAEEDDLCCLKNGRDRMVPSQQSRNNLGFHLL